MSLFPKPPKWESQNWDSYHPKTLNTHIFLKSNLFQKCEGNPIILKKIFPTLHNTPQSNLI